MVTKKTFGGGLTRMLYIILVSLFMLCIIAMFSSCMTTQKAVNYLKNNEQLDDVCAENYPVTAKGPDTTVTEKNAVDAIFLQQIKRQRDSALRRLGYLESLRMSLDTTKCRQLLNEYINTVSNYEQQLDSLHQQLQTIKSKTEKITETKVDSAALSALRGQHKQLQKDFQAYVAKAEKEKQFAAAQLQQANDDTARWQATAKDRRNQLIKSIGLNAILILLLLWRVYRGIRRKGISLLNPLKWFT